MSETNDGQPSNMWSRRRAAVKAEAEAEIKAAKDAQLEQDLAQLEEKSDAEILQELDLPDPDNMQEGADFSRFMQATVPDRLRRRALRKLWLTNPMLANLDELLDYGDDFTDNAMIIENMQTAYQVGKGMLKHVNEMARQSEEDEASSEQVVEEASALTGENQEGDESALNESEPEFISNNNPELINPRDDSMLEEVESPDDEEETPPEPIRRRMRFEFDS